MQNFQVFGTWDNFIHLEMNFINRSRNIVVNLGMLKIKQGYLLSIEFHQYKNYSRIKCWGKVSYMQMLICVYFSGIFFDLYIKTLVCIKHSWLLILFSDIFSSIVPVRHIINKIKFHLLSYSRLPLQASLKMVHNS